jgi:hypothetical protein
MTVPSCTAARLCLPSASATIIVVVPLLFAGTTTIRATLGLVLEALFLVESLLAFGEDECRVAVLACQCFVSHCEYTSLFNIWNESFPGAALQE